MVDDQGSRQGQDVTGRLAAAGFYGLGFSGAGWAVGKVLGRVFFSFKRERASFVTRAASGLAGAAGAIYGWWRGVEYPNVRHKECEEIATPSQHDVSSALTMRGGHGEWQQTELGHRITRSRTDTLTR